MTDERVTVETSPGWRPPTSLPERAVIALALVVLLGSALIVLGNLLPGSLGVAGASPTPAAARSPVPTRTARPAPTPRQLRMVEVQPATPTPTAAPSPVHHGWVRALTELPILPEPSDTARPVGTLAAGEVAFAFEEPEVSGWLYVIADSRSGFVSTDGSDGVQLEFHRQAPGVVSGYVWDVEAGESGFLAIGATPGAADAWRPLVAASEDGARWRVVDAPTELSGAAWGIGGWIGVSAAHDGRSAWVHRSTDGERWETLGVLRSLGGFTHPTGLFGSQIGYLLRTESSNGRDNRTELWYSADGRTWRESEGVGGFRQARQMGLAATDIGFLAWETRVDVASETAGVHFSPDGRRWSEAAGGPSGAALVVTELAGEILAIDHDLDAGSARVWIGALGVGGLAWRRDTDSERVFAGASVTALVSDGAQAIAFGWDHGSEVARVWTGGPSGWTEEALPASFGGAPRLAAAGEAGVVVLGYRPTLRGENPVFWHRDPGGRWAPEEDPVLELVPDPSSANCPSPPTDALQWAVLDPTLAVVCFGGQPITFQAWSVRCSECYAVRPGIAEPAWLAAPERNQLYLTPAVRSQGSWISAVLAPSLELQPEWTDAWIEVTGHFDDPAATGCRWQPGPEDQASFGGGASVINECRQRFVVTEVRLLDGS